METILNISFPYSNFSLSQTNVMTLIQNAYYNSIQINYQFCWCCFYRSRVMPLTKWEKCLSFHSLILNLPQPNVMRLKAIVNTSNLYHREQIQT